VYFLHLHDKIGLKNIQAGVYKFCWFDCAGERNEKQEHSMDIVWCWFGVYLHGGLFYRSCPTAGTALGGNY